MLSKHVHVGTPAVARCPADNAVAEGLVYEAGNAVEKKET